MQMKVLTRNRMLLLGTVFSFLVLFLAVLALFLSQQDYTRQNLKNTLKPPFWMKGGSVEHPLGTDHLGRDLFARICYGARVSLLVGIVSVLIAGTIGISLGLIAGYWGGWLDSFIMRIADIQLSFPPIFLAIAMMAVLPQGVMTLILVLGGISWVQFGRVARGSTLAVKEKDFIEAARAVGASDMKILVHHILPNILSPLIVISTVYVSSLILAEAALSFLGLGVQPPTPSWGSMLSEGRTYFKIAWWYATFPGLTILLTALGINMLGEGLRRRP